MEKINVVFGATGRLGYALCLELKKRGLYVRAVCRKSSPITPLVQAIADEVVFGDIRNRDDVFACTKNASVVYHLVAVISIVSKPSPDLMQINVGGTRLVVDACKRENARLVYVSSVHAIDFTNNTSTLAEPTRYNPTAVRGAYAKSKALASNMVLDEVKYNNLDAIICLPSGITGPYEYTLSNIGQMIGDVYKGKMPFYMTGEYDFVDVRDVCTALADLSSAGVAGESYIISGNKLTIRQILNTVADHLQVKQPTIKVPMFAVKIGARSMERKSLKRGLKPTFTPFALRVLSDNCNFSHQKLTSLTGYSPRPAEQSLKDQVDFYIKEILKQK